MKKGRPILQIVPRVPGGREGVGDYACTLARRLRESHGWETTFLVPNLASEKEVDGFEVLSPLPEGPDALPETYHAIVLHYVNYGYDRRGIPLSFPKILARLKGRGKLLTVFHELYASGSWRQSAFWLGPLQRRIAASLAQISETAIVSSHSLADQLKRLSPRTSIIVHPVFSNFGEPTEITAANRDPKKWVICGGTELIERSLRSFLPTAPFLRGGFEPRELLVVGGAPSPEVRRILEQRHTFQTAYYPDVEAEVASELLATCVWGWIDYFHQKGVPTAAILKSTAFAAYCAHGIIPVLAHAAESFGLGTDQFPGPFFAASSGHSLPSGSDRAGIAQSIQSWYHRNASSTHLSTTVARALGEFA